MAALALASWTNVGHAINKCTTADGQTIYQQASCPGNAKTEELKITVPTGTTAGIWKFTREKDSMTGEVGCFATSPSETTNFSRGMHTYNTVYLQLYAKPESSTMLLTVRTYGGSVFHHDMTGQGIKVDGSPFLPLTKHYSQKAIGIGNDALAPIIGALQNGKDFRLRLRFWPYETLHDTQPIPTTGFKQAVLQAMRCLVK